MKKILLSVVALLGAATIYAQKTYVSVSEAMASRPAKKY